MSSRENQDIMRQRPAGFTSYVSFGTISKVEASIDEEEAAEILIFIDNEDMTIVNPLFSSWADSK